MGLRAIAEVPLFRGIVSNYKEQFGFIQTVCLR
jgi:hypothetical protein